jgi:hypothetical protein
VPACGPRLAGQFRLQGRAELFLFMLRQAVISDRQPRIGRFTADRAAIVSCAPTRTFKDGLLGSSATRTARKHRPTPIGYLQLGPGLTARTRRGGTVRVQFGLTWASRLRVRFPRRQSTRGHRFVSPADHYLCAWRVHDENVIGIPLCRERQKTHIIPQPRWWAHKGSNLGPAD